MNLKDFIKAILAFILYISIVLASALLTIVYRWAHFCGVILVVCLAFHWPFSFAWVTLVFVILVGISLLSKKGDKHAKD